MRVFVLLVLAGVALAQNPFFQAATHRQRFRPQQQFRRPQQQQFRRPQQQQFRQQHRQQQRPSQNSISRDPAAHDEYKGKEYHYSWRNGARQLTGGQAAGYCRGLGQGWHSVDIESDEENKFVTRVIEGERLEYIWTGGRLSGGWRWSNGRGIGYKNWSHTGGANRPQPDQRERSGEPCLAILNNFYRDGVKWHDVACNHRKPTICEKN